jgi:hypothetical protein
MTDKPKWLQGAIEFLIDNLTVLLTIGFAGYILYRQEVVQAAVSTDELLTAILAVLALLATSEIVERYRRLGSIERAVGRTLSLMESRFTDRPSAIGFFRKPPDLDAHVASANQIDLLGATLTTTVNKQFSHLRERLRQGAEVRVLIMDPDSLGLQMSANRSGTADDQGYYRTRLEATFRDLEYLAKEVAHPGTELQPLQQRNLAQGGSLSVRLLSYAPSFGLISFDAGCANGIAFVEIYPHMIFREQPSFDLTAQRDGQWYTFFVQQFDEMWSGAKPWEPGSALRAREG